MPPGLAAIEVGARARRAIKLTGTVRPGPVPVLVTATQPVVVERDLYAIGSLGTAMSPAVPLRD